MLVGFHTNDDAGVYLLKDGMALVQTVDFFTPIVDDPYTFGQIAAANSLSDIYAMGGHPVSALSIVGFPEKGDPAILEQIIRGGLSKMEEARCSVVGGHSIRNEDIQFGYAVAGLIEPSQVWRNVGAEPGDALLLTKAIGTGVISTALKQDRAASEWVASAIASMTELNRTAAEVLRDVDQSSGKERPIHAVTDITGFGLLGHAREMALGDPQGAIEPVSLEVDHSAVSYLPGALEAARAGFLPGGLKNNREFVGGCVNLAEHIAQQYRDLLFDPQTSGGLLVAVAADVAPAALAALERSAVSANRIGRVLPKGSPLIRVI